LFVKNNTIDLLSDSESRLRKPFQKFTVFFDVRMLDGRNINEYERHDPKKQKVKRGCKETKFEVGKKPVGNYLARVTWGRASAAISFKVKKKGESP
jgi:hypothetical protein